MCSILIECLKRFVIPHRLSLLALRTNTWKASRSGQTTFGTNRKTIFGGGQIHTCLDLGQLLWKLTYPPFSKLPFKGAILLPNDITSNSSRAPPFFDHFAESPPYLTMHPLRVFLGQKKGWIIFVSWDKDVQNTKKCKNIGDLEQVVKIKEQLSMIKASPFSFESTQNL